MPTRQAAPVLAVLVLAAAAAAEAPPGEAFEERGLDKIRCELLAAQTGLCALCVAAHPGDVDFAVLASLRRVEGVEAHLCLATSGEARALDLAFETGSPLAARRTREIESAARIVGAKVWRLGLADPRPDRGAEEVLALWDKDVALERLVRVIRTLQPEIVISMAAAGRLGAADAVGGVDEAVDRLLGEAREAAADPARFHKQLDDDKLTPCRVWKFYRLDPRAEDGTPLPVGAPDPVSGRSAAEWGARARRELSSFGAAEETAVKPGDARQLRLVSPRGTATAAGPAGEDARGSLVSPRGTATAERGLLAGLVPLPFPTLEMPADLTRQPPPSFQHPAEVWATPPTQPSPAWSLLRLERARDPQDCLWVWEGARILLDPAQREKPELVVRARRSLAHVESALTEALGLRLEATAHPPLVAAGEEATVTARFVNAGPLGLALEGWQIIAKPGWQVGKLKTPPAALKPGAVVEACAQVCATEAAVPDYPPGQRFQRGAESGPLQVEARVHLKTQWHEMSLALPTIAAPLSLAPAMAARFEPDPVLVFDDPGRGDKDLVLCRARLVATSYQHAPWTIYARLAPDERFQVRMEKDAVFSFQAAGQSLSAEFRFMVPAAVFASGDLSASAILWTKEYRFGTAPAVRFRRVPLKLPAPLHVGVVRGPAGVAWEALKVLAADERGFALLDATPESLRDGDLSALHALVIEPRGAAARPDVLRQNSRLREYMEGGGTLIWIGSRADDGALAGAAPFPLRLSAPHVALEKPSVKLPKPDHPLLTRPCRLWEKDFEGWAASREACRAAEWDWRYASLLSLSGTGGAVQDGLLLAAPVGRGQFIYVGLPLASALRNGVPGAYRLLANLVGFTREP